MALSAVLDNLTDIPEDVAKEYTEKDGKFYLEVTPYVNGSVNIALENIAGMKSALQTERSNVSTLESTIRTAESNLNAFKGLDPIEAREAIEKVKNFKPKADASEQLEALRAQLSTKFGEEKKELETKIAQATSEIKSLMITDAALTAIAAANGNATLLMPHVIKDVRLRDQNGQYFVEIIDPKTKQVRVSPAADNSNPMSVVELVEEMKGATEFAPCFEGSGATGSGATGGSASTNKGASGPSGAGTVADPLKISADDQVAIDNNFEKIGDGTAIVVPVKE